MSEFLPIEVDRRQIEFIEQRRISSRQIERVFRIPASIFNSDVYQLAAFTREGRIESKIRLKVIGQ